MGTPNREVSAVLLEGEIAETAAGWGEGYVRAREVRERAGGMGGVRSLRR
jgi:hypothetical protein